MSDKEALKLAAIATAIVGIPLLAAVILPRLIG
jgi:hypothetical protein